MTKRMARYWRAVQRLGKGPEAREIRHHARIGGSIAAALTLLEIAREFFGKRLIELLPHWEPAAAVLAVLGALGLALIAYRLAFLAIRVQEVRMRTPISLTDVGIIDGDWVYAMRDVDDVAFNRGSIMHVESLGVVFQIKGWSYVIRDQQPGPDEIQLDHLGEFRAEGVAWKESRVHYCYSGRENGIADTGVGYYSFSERDGHLFVDGRFTGSSLGPDCRTATRFLQGRQIYTKGLRHDLGLRAEEFTKTLVKELIAELNDCSSNPELQFSFEQAGVVDGYWIDAIYEKGENNQWKIIEGSVIQIESSREAKRFAIKGWAYLWDELKNADHPKEVRPPYSFLGEGRPMKGAPGFYYHYAGFERGLEAGAGYYVFQRDDEDRLTFFGAFMRRIGAAHRIVYGRKIKMDQWVDRARHLQDHLAECERRAPHVLDELQGT